MMQSLESAWLRSADDSGREQIKQTLDRLLEGLTEEQLALTVEYEKERVGQSERNVEDNKTILCELEAELKKRETRPT